MLQSSQLNSFNDILQNVYQSVRSKAFPINTPLLGALGGIGSSIDTRGLQGSSLQTLSMQQAMFQQQRLLEQRTGWYDKPLGPVYPGKLEFDTKHTFCPCGQCPTERDIAKDAYTVNQTANCWLDSRIERVRLLGREWLIGNRTKLSIDSLAIKQRQAPPAVGGMREPLSVNGGIPVRYLRNGADALFAYDNMPEGFQNWLQKAQTVE